MKLKGLGKKSTEMLWKKFKEQLSNYLPLTGGTMKGLLTIPYGTAVHYNYGANGSDGYVHLATIVIKAAYVYAPIELTITRRADSHPTKIVILFDSTSSNDPTVRTFNVVGATANVWIYKSAASTWELYVKKNGAWDEVNVAEYHEHLYVHDRITVTWQKDQISTLPDGAVQATVGEFLGVASTSTGIADYNDKDAIVEIGYSGNSLDYSSLAYLAGYTNDRKIKDVSKDAVKSYLGITKYDSEHNWKSKDPVLLFGEIAISDYSSSLLNDYKYKVGNGTSKWSELPYAYTNGITLPTSGKTNKKKWIKFATVDLHELGAWEGCGGLFKLFQTESQGAIGMLKFQFRNGSTAGTIERGNLIWVSLNSPDYANSVCAVSTGDGTRDLYYRPIFDYDTTSIVVTDVYNPRRITVQSDNTYVANVTPVTTSYVSSYASSAKSASEVNGHTVNADVPENAKFTDTTYSRFKQGTPSSNPVDGLVPAPNSKASERAMLTVGGWEELDLHVGHTSDGKLMIGQLWSDEYVLMDEIPVATQEESGAMSSDDKEKLDNIDVDTLKAELKKYIDQNSSGGVSIDTIYPVGSIYLTMDIKFDPNKSFGGTWEITSEGKALFGADITGQDPDFEVPGLTGGEKTHTLTVDELPEHNHNIKVESEELKGSVWNFVGQNANYGPGNSTSGVFSKGGDGTCFYPSSTGKATGINDGFVLDATHDHTATSGNTGSGTAHNNLPPYQTIVVWQRTA